jgi:hypothetical protein
LGEDPHHEEHLQEHPHVELQPKEPEPIQSQSQISSDKPDDSKIQTSAPVVGTLEVAHPEETKSISQRLKNLFKKLRKSQQLLQALNPSLVTVTFALLIGIIPPVKSLFYGTNPPLGFITDVVEMMGRRTALPSLLG